MADESPAIRAFIDTRRALLAAPRAGAWVDAVGFYADLADDFADRSVFWSSGWATNTDAFKEQRNQAAAAGEILGLAAAQLQSASPDLVLDAAWQESTLRAMQAVALIAGAWDAGVDTLLRARASIPGDVAQGAADVIETVGQATEGRGPLIWGAVAGAVVLVGGLVLASRLRR